MATKNYASTSSTLYYGRDDMSYMEFILTLDWSSS